MLIARFQIEDLIVQDESGVVFRAMDAETGMTVAVRRFFPFGAHGGGLDPEEQTAYNIAIARLADLRHPALRAVVCGGCDPVDGMPFIATEWIDGGSIGPLVRRENLPPQVAAELLTQALEVSELLSQVLAEEAVWVDTDPDSIVLGSETSGRGFTFWISPFKWLGAGKQARGLESLVALTEQLMGWRGRIIGDQAGGGLGAWLKWLRANATVTSLREARENLAAALGSEPPADVSQLLDLARQMPREKHKSSMPLILGIIGLALVVVGTGGWLWTWHRGKQLRQSKVMEKILAETEAQSRDAARSVDEINAEAARLGQEAAEIGRKSVFSPEDGDLLARREGGEASLEGVVRKIEASQSGRTLYVLFSDNPGRNDPRGAVEPDSDGYDITSLEALVGHKVSITGKVRVTRTAGLSRPEIHIDGRESIRKID
jgi:hypothetical protein